MERDERDKQAGSRAEGLVDLVRPHLPIEVRVTGPADVWALVDPGLIARQVGAIEALIRLHPSGRDAESIVLLRSLYDHAVTFAWLAADPSAERHQRFLKSDSAARLRAADDCRKVGVEILPYEKRADYQRHVDQLPAEMPPLLDRATQADEHWAGRIEGLRGADTTHSYRGLYAIAYRRYSSYDHASLLGLNPVVADLDDGRQRVQFEERNPEEHGVYGMASVLFSFSLFISAQTLGWPETDAVHEVFEHSA